MRYVWDPKKNAANVRKHGISFSRAVMVFKGPVLETEDDRFDYGETRIQAIGLADGKEIFVAYTDEGDSIRRIISARKAEPHERKAYWEAIARAQ